MSCTPFFRMVPSIWHTLLTTSWMQTLSCLTTRRCSLREAESMMSHTSTARRLPPFLMTLTILCIEGGQEASERIESDSPMMPVRGVRSSWQSVAKKCSWRRICFFWSLMSVSTTMIAGCPVTGSLEEEKRSMCHRSSTSSALSCFFSTSTTYSAFDLPGTQMQKTRSKVASFSSRLRHTHESKMSLSSSGCSPKSAALTSPL
mmetsp:Transcript_55062/g.128833  ORF Transcript_55062/g.128833 Transcript_55062/m.128833 type:complete len:203 (+) Transcript_55062:2296-2904(+)